MSTVCYFTDTHCHLDFASFDQDRVQVIERAREVGIKRMLNPGIDLETSKEAIALAEGYEELYAAVGVHPNSAMSWGEKTYMELERLASHPKVVAIGEIGLDYYRNGAPAEMQRNVFQTQLDLAAKLGLPVIIHNRNASDEIITALSNWIDSLVKNRSRLLDKPGVLHSFSGTWEQAQWAVKNNFFIGINGPVTYKNAAQLHQLVRDVSIDNILVETDSPFLPPHPHRGKRNEPARITLIAGKIAEMRTIEKNEIARATSANAERLFCWRKID